MNMPPDGATARFGSLAEYIAKTSQTRMYSTVRIYCFAGHSSRDPGQPTDACKVSLGRQLERFVSTNCPSWKSKLKTGSEAWSTYGEIRRAIMEAYKEGISLSDEDVTLVIASNLAHLPRIWLICCWLKPDTWRLKLVRAHHFFGLRSIVGEPFAILKNIFLRFRLKDFKFRDFIREHEGEKIVD